MVKQQTALGAGVLALGVFFVVGSFGISSDAGYGGVGPNFLPLLTGLGLLLGGLGLVYESVTGGFRSMDEPDGAAHGDWLGFAWVSAGVLVNALLIDRLGFILACTACFALAVRGLRLSKGEGLGHPKVWALDLATGAAIAAPVFWLFTKGLAISLPGLTATGWI